MKFLDEDVSVTFTSIPSHSDGLYIYTLGRADDSTVLFIGKVFIPSSKSSIDIYLSDILNSFRYQNLFIKAYPESSSIFTTDLIQRYKVTLTVGSTSINQYADMCMMYRYPNRKNALETEFTLNPISKHQILLQGSKYVDNKWKLQLKPHIPYIDTTAFGFGLITANNQTGNTPIQYKGTIHGENKTIYATGQEITDNYFTLHDLFVNTTIGNQTTSDVFNLECGLTQVYDIAHYISDNTFEAINGINALKVALLGGDFTKWGESEIWTATGSAVQHSYMFFGNPGVYYIAFLDEEEEIYALLTTGEVFRDENNLFTINIAMRRGEDGAIVQISDVMCTSQNIYLQTERLCQDEDDPTDAAYLTDVEVAVAGDKLSYTSFWYGQDQHCYVYIIDNNGDLLSYSQNLYDISQGSGAVDITYGFSGFDNIWCVAIGCLDDANYGLIELISDEFSDPNNFFNLTFHIDYEERADEWYISDLSIKKTLTEPIDLSAPRVDYNDNDWFDVDECAAPYYLQWIDRYGSYQCQPFEGKSLFNEQISRNSIQDFKGHRRNVQWSVNGKWSLNTGWLSEELYPYYESILISPKVVLYDTEEDKAYDVNITDTSYDEKTWKNQKKMFNFSVNVEIDKNQNIVN